MSAKLKPCPFCGSEHVDHRLVMNAGAAWHYVKCHVCEAKGPPSVERAMTAASERAAKGASTKGWNRRAKTEADQ